MNIGSCMTQGRVVYYVKTAAGKFHRISARDCPHFQITFKWFLLWGHLVYWDQISLLASKLTIFLIFFVFLQICCQSRPQGNITVHKQKSSYLKWMFQISQNFADSSIPVTQLTFVNAGSCMPIGWVAKLLFYHICFKCLQFMYE